MISVNYENKVSFDIIENDRHLHVFRILQELMNNSLRYGKATVISILFESTKLGKICYYSNNGIGFDSYISQKGLGMKNIESRVAFLKVIITMNSSINNGVSVVFNF